MTAAFILLVWHEATGALECFSNAGDEGMEVNKALLVSEGHRLYSEIWNDQPPLYTLALSRLVCGRDAGMERLRRASFLSAAALMVAMCGVGTVLGLSWGELICASGFLIASPLFLPCSASTTLEIPALSAGWVGAWFLMLGIARRSLRLAALGGGVMGIAVMIKLTALSVIPLIGGFAAVGLVSVGRRRVWGVLAVALATFTATTAVVWHVCSEGASWRHLLGTHFSAYPALDAEAREAYRFRWDWFSWQPFFALAAAGGLFSLVRSSRCWAAVVLGPWVAFVVLVFASHFPWWNYYSVHLNAPLALLAGIGLLWGIRWSVTRWRGGLLQVGGRFVAAALVVACLWEWGEAFAVEARRVRRVGRWQDNPIVRCVRERVTAAGNHRPTMLQLVSGPYAVHCGLEPLPWYAVLPFKRRWTGELTDEALAAQIRAQKAEVLLAPALEMAPPELAEAVQARYQQVCASEDVSVWVPRNQ